MEIQKASKGCNRRVCELAFSGEERTHWRAGARLCRGCVPPRSQLGKECLQPGVARTPGPPPYWPQRRCRSQRYPETHRGTFEHARNKRGTVKLPPQQPQRRRIRCKPAVCSIYPHSSDQTVKMNILASFPRTQTEKYNKNNNTSVSFQSGSSENGLYS